MKRLLLIAALLVYSFATYAQEAVTLVVNGEGTTKEEATANALRNAIEQAFGTFVSANTQILNDEIVKDEIATISSGNIQKYSELGCVTMPDGHKSISLSATVSIGNLISYAKSKGASTEFAGAVWSMNLKMRKLNAENEKKALENLISMLDKFVDANGLFDISIMTDGIPYKMSCADNLAKTDIPCYGMYHTLNYTTNNNTKQVFNTIISTLESLSISQEDRNTLENSNEKYFELSIVDSLIYNPGGTSSDWYTAKNVTTFYLRNNPIEFAEQLIHIVNEGIYSSVFIINGLEYVYQISSCGVTGIAYNIQESRSKASLMIDDRDYKNAKEHLGHWNRTINWRELLFTPLDPNSKKQNTILTYSRIPITSISIHWSFIGENSLKYMRFSPVVLYNNVTRTATKSLTHQNSVVVCIDNIFNYAIVGKKVYQIKFDFPLTEDELERCTGFSVVPRNEHQPSQQLSLKGVQEGEKTSSSTRTDDILSLSKDVIEPIPFQLVEEKPSFQGGDINQFLKWVRENQIYPEIAKENGIQGRVTVRVTINTDGSLTDITVIRGVDPLLDKEAIRVVSQSPKWEPGKQGGKVIPVIYNFPVTFQIR